MLQNYKYFTKFGWNSNPFTLSIYPDLLVGYSRQTDALLSHISNFHKVGMIIGPTGSGKTTVLTWLNSYISKNNGFRLLYIPKPPINEKGLILLFKSLLGYNFLDKLKFRSLDINKMSEFINEKIKNQKTIFLIDEAHECSLEVLQWLRTLNDSCPNMILIFAGLSTFEDMLTSKLPTLSMRITTKVYLKSLNETETESLIKKRIEKVGGNGIEPFTSDSINEIYKITGGFPREIIKSCDILIKKAAENNISVINKSFVEKILEKTETTGADEIRLTLTKRQKEILSLLNENKKLSPSDIVQYIDISEYKTKSHAIRSVNNILRRLMTANLLKREKIGNTYLYFLSGKAKTIFTKA